MARDWFRNEMWTPEIRAEFEQRLARARAYKRTQYLRIQGVHLQRAGHIDAARELWLRVLDQSPSADRSSGDQRATAMEHLGDSYARSDPTTAERWYRRLLAEYPQLDDTSRLVELSLAEMLVAQRRCADARAALTAWGDRGGLHTPADLLRAQLVLVDIAEAEGDLGSACQAARQALEVVELPSPYANHPQIGLAHLDPATRKRLTRLARPRRSFRLFGGS